MAKEEEWRRRVSEWRSQGVPASVYCAERGIAPKQLQTWAWKLGLSQAKVSPAAGTPMHLIRLSPKGDEIAKAERPISREAANSGVRLSMAGITVDLQSNFDHTVLLDVLSVLGSHAGAKR